MSYLFLSRPCPSQWPFQEVPLQRLVVDQLPPGHQVKGLLDLAEGARLPGALHEGEAGAEEVPRAGVVGVVLASSGGLGEGPLEPAV